MEYFNEICKNCTFPMFCLTEKMRNMRTCSGPRLAGGLCWTDSVMIFHIRRCCFHCVRMIFQFSFLFFPVCACFVTVLMRSFDSATAVDSRPDRWPARNVWTFINSAECLLDGVFICFVIYCYFRWMASFDCQAKRIQRFEFQLHFVDLRPEYSAGWF